MTSRSGCEALKNESGLGSEETGGGKGAEIIRREGPKQGMTIKRETGGQKGEREGEMGREVTSDEVGWTEDEPLFGSRAGRRQALKIAGTWP